MLEVLSPVTGRSQAVSEMPDPVFAKGLVGPGMAITPQPGRQTAVAPISGKVLRLLPHAFLVRSSLGPGVLVHLGIDTVHMQGDGFTMLVAQDDTVEAGDDVVSWDPGYVTSTGRSPICAVILLDCDIPFTVDPEDRAVIAAEPLFSVDC
jgi:glucose-specific phosphotransferase system IIA component